MDRLYTAMENSLAHFIYDFNENCLALKDSPCAWELFLDAGDTCMDIDGTWKALGKTELWEMLTSMQEKQKAMGRTFFIFASSPAYDCEGTRGRLSCDTYVYVYEKEGGGGLGCQLRIMRMDLAFLWSEGAARICECQWRTIQTMEPWSDPGKRGEMGVPLGAALRDKGLLGLSGVQSPEAYVLLKKLANRLWDRLLENTEELFENEAEATRLKTFFQTADEARPPVVISGPVSVELSQSGFSARVVAVVEVFKVKQGGGGSVVERSFAYVRLLAGKNGGSWKICSAQARTVFVLPDTAYTPGVRYDKFSCGLLPWTLHNHNQTGQWIGDSYAIENIINQWVYACRRGELTKFFEKYMADEAFVPKMWIKSQGEGTPKLEGTEAIQARLEGMDRHFVNRMYSYHTATTPLIEISSDGQSATGTWYDHSATNLSSEAISPTKIPYMVFVARYVHKFRKFHGQWYLTDFFWEPLIHLEPWHFDLNRSKGWVQLDGAGNYPQVFAFLRK